MAGSDKRLDLASFLDEASRRAFVWGTFDCCLYGSDWIKSRCGIDPARKLRGTYRTRAGARKHMLRAGGFLPLTRGLMAPHGFVETDTPTLGDVAIVDTPQGHVIGIRTSIGYAVKSEQGLFVNPYKLVTAWKIGE